MNPFIEQIRKRQIVEILRVKKYIKKVRHQNWDDCKENNDSNQPSRKATQFGK